MERRKSHLILLKADFIKSLLYIKLEDNTFFLDVPPIINNFISDQDRICNMSTFDECSLVSNYSGWENHFYALSKNFGKDFVDTRCQANRRKVRNLLWHRFFGNENKVSGIHRFVHNTILKKNRGTNSWSQLWICSNIFFEEFNGEPIRTRCFVTSQRFDATTNFLFFKSSSEIISLYKSDTTPICQLTTFFCRFPYRFHRNNRWKLSLYRHQHFQTKIRHRITI